MQAAGRRRHPGVPSPAPPLFGPCRDRIRVGAGLPAQARSLAGQRFIVPPLGRALEDPGHLGEQISPAPGKRAELSNRGGFVAAGQVAPSGPVPRLARQLGDEDTVSFRALSIMLSSMASIGRLRYGARDIGLQLVGDGDTSRMHPAHICYPSRSAVTRPRWVAMHDPARLATPAATLRIPAS